MFFHSSIDIYDAKPQKNQIPINSPCKKAASWQLITQKKRRKYNKFYQKNLKIIRIQKALYFAPFRTANHRQNKNSFVSKSCAVITICSCTGEKRTSWLKCDHRGEINKLLYVMKWLLVVVVCYSMCCSRLCNFTPTRGCVVVRAPTSTPLPLCT